MKHIIIAAILFAVSASNVDAQQTITVMNGSQRYWAVPSGTQPYQPQGSQHLVQPVQSGYYQPQTLQPYQQQTYIPQQQQTYVPQQSYATQNQMQPVRSGYYPSQTLQTYQQQPHISQPSAIPTYYYPQQLDLTGVVSQTLPTATAQSDRVLENSLQIQNKVQSAETQALQPQQDYAALPIKSRPPAPSIPPQPGDLVGPATTGFTSRSMESDLTSALNKQKLQTLQSTATAPASSTALEPKEPVVSAEVATAVNQPEPQAAIEAPVAPQADTLVGELVDTPKTETAVSRNEPSLTTEELAAESAATEEVKSATEELAASVEELPAVKQPAIQELVNAEPTKVETTESSSAHETNHLSLDLGELSSETTESVKSTAPISEDLAATEADFQAEPIPTKTETETKPVIAAGTTAPSDAETNVVATDSTPIKPGGRSYGAWMLALIPILGLPLIAWIYVQKKKRNDKDHQFAEDALNQINTDESSSSATTMVAPAPPIETITLEQNIAFTQETTSAKEKASFVETDAPITATLVEEEEATPLAARPLVQTEEIKTSVHAAAASASDASTTGILSSNVT